MNWLKWITHTRRVLTFFRENREWIKSITLTLLILLSLVLTWSLWTFKPSYSTIEDARTVKKQTVKTQDQLSFLDVVHPTQVIYHDGSELYGAEANNLVNKFHDALKETSFTFETSSKNNQTFDPGDDRFLKNTDYVEVIYPVGMTSDLYKEVFSFESDIASKIQNVDRIYLYQNATGDVEGYLISYMPKKKQKIKAVNDGALKPLLKDMSDSIAKGDLVSYISHDLTEETSEGEKLIKDRFYFPMKSLKIKSNAYISNAINDETKEKYKKALFKDPLSVKSASTAVNEETFTDGTAAMVIKERENRFTYTNFAGNSNGSLSPINSPLFLSVDYVNTHAGWGGNPYILSELDNEEAGFWLFVDELPVLDNEMLMLLSWNESELYQYERSIVELDTQSKYTPGDLSETIELESGFEVKQKLIDAELNENYIQDIRIGYSIKRQNEPHVYFLEPKWFIKYENQGWSSLFKTDREEGF